MKFEKIGLAFLIGILSSCEKSVDSPEIEGAPAWVSTRVAEYRNEPIQNPPREISSFDLPSGPLYRVSSPCCDQFDSLFNSAGKFVCALGGLRGIGDGQCSEDVQSQGSGRLLWRDKRGEKFSRPQLMEKLSGEKIGCGDFELFRKSENEKKVLALYSTAKILGDTTFEVDLVNSNEMTLKMVEFGESVNLTQQYCNDVADMIKQPIKSLQAFGGKIRIKVSHFQSGFIKTYRVSVNGDNIMFKEGGTVKMLKKFDIDSVDVGWFPG